MKAKLVFLFVSVVAASLMGCAALTQLNQTANDLNKTATDLDNTAKNAEGTAKKVDNNLDKANDAANKLGPVELEDDGGSNSSEAYCCVNGTFYNCTSAAAAGQCVGDPMAMMDCLNACGDTACEDQCTSKYGPDPSPCSRDAGQDGRCAE
ncbi:MAG: hypothetical protein AUK47_21770 [Deltaproteobacteria bacterium CG2_30_63_29]|nr:MAG: hypothetical protein AUK47_21770 [Deltaproteobacteria bacterium CG2_30_63_29]PJB37012.1 MAG: hypothetical protein CO108_22005 [Deltaproteobacteria bacterium CG_4_9_14_3_um_filter_63_12]